jgi:hypothetical protein
MVAAVPISGKHGFGGVLGVFFDLEHVFASQKRRFPLPFASLRFIEDDSTACAA